MESVIDLRGIRKSWLNRLEKALASYTSLTANSSVAVASARKECVAVAGMMEATEPITIHRHDVIEGHILAPLKNVVDKLATYQVVTDQDVARLIKASEAARILA